MDAMLRALNGASINCITHNACAFGAQTTSFWSSATPYITAFIALFAALAAASIAHSAKISEFREKWLDGLRQDIADYVGAAAKWYRKWDETNASDEVNKAEFDEVYSLGNAANVILWRIKLRINPRENRFKSEDEAFLKALEALIDPNEVGPRNPQSSWHILANEAVGKGREILKREWEVTKRLRISFWRR